MASGKPPMLSAGFILLCGCVSQPARPVAHAAPPAPAQPNGPVPSVEASVNDDPCAIQLTSIEGALADYYLMNQRLPDKLEEIQNYRDVLDPNPIVLTCPTSHQPYVYKPAGLVSPNSRKRIIVYDPTPAHRGGRFVLWMEPQPSGKGLVMDVKLLPDKEFKPFVPPLEP